VNNAAELPFSFTALSYIRPYVNSRRCFCTILGGRASVGSWLSGLFGIAGTNANILILSGIVGFLTGVTRKPFISAILVLEMTDDRHTIIFHLMLAALVANIIAMVIDKHSLYDQLKHGFAD
jgi:H+/Cl- antiporter ClcA